MTTPLPNPILFDPDELKNDPEAFCNSLNQFAASVRDNIDAINNSYQVDTYTAYISDGARPYPFSFRWRNAAAVPQSCVCGYIDADDGTEGVLSGIIPRWKYSEGRVIILGMRGTLTQNKNYTFVFLTTGK